MKDFKVYQASGMLTELVKNASDVRKTEQTISGGVVNFNILNSIPVKISVIVNSTTPVNSITLLHSGKWLYASNYGSNEFDGYEVNKYLNVDGSTASNSSYYISGYMPIPENTHCRRANSNSRNLSMCFYDENKNYINGIQYNNISIAFFTTEPDTHYVRMSAGKGASNNWQRVEVDCYDEVFNIPAEIGSITSGLLLIDYDGSVTLVTGGQTYELQSISPIITVVGDNNIWSDASEVSVTYPI